jgi:ABC-type dipeptide/oligopeptide/nickel transport system permease component
LPDDPEHGTHPPRLIKSLAVPRKLKLARRARTAAGFAVFLVKRLLGAAAVLVLVGIFTFGLIRWLRPEQYHDPLIAGTRHDLGRAFLHFDFGPGCSANPACFPVRLYWERGWRADLIVLFGGIAVGVVIGIALGLWCARHRRSLRARSIEAAAMFFYCAPSFVLAYGLLLLFNSTFGAFPVPYLFDALPQNYDSIAHPLVWLSAYWLPVTLVGLPIAGAIIRLLPSGVREEMDADYIRTAIAKGLTQRRVVRRHAAPGVFPQVTALVWALVPITVTNAVLIESTLSVPGFFLRIKAASGHTPPPVSSHPPPPIDIPMLQGAALWIAALILVLTLLTDLALLIIDPRVRASGA